MQEVWKDIEGYENYHKISNLGRVRSFYEYDKDKRLYVKKEYIHKQYEHPVGHKQAYKIVYLSAPNRSGQLQVHRLVLQAFIPNILGKPYCNHIDSNPSNNNVNNLEWVTHKENMQHSSKYGRMAKNKERYFTDEMIAKVVLSYKNGLGVQKISRDYSIPRLRIHDILKMKNIKRRTLEEHREFQRTLKEEKND
jgi:hypothetical protein